MAPTRSGWGHRARAEQRDRLGPGPRDECECFVAAQTQVSHRRGEAQRLSFPGGAGLVDEASLAAGWVQPVHRASPDPASVEVLAGIFAQYVAAGPALAPVMHGLADAAGG